MYKLVVLFSVLALAAAKPYVGVAPVAYTTYGAVPAVSSVSQYSSNVVHGSPVVPAVYSGYSPYFSTVGVVPAVGALAQPPNTPAVVLDPVHGVPLDTPEVVAARVAHYQAKALSGVHTIAKRSVVTPVTYSSVVSPYTSVAHVSPYVSSVVSPVYTTPYVSTYGALAPGYGYPAVVPKALSVHPY